MSAPRATVLVLVPGRETFRFEVSTRWPYALTSLVMAAMLGGATARRYLDPVPVASTAPTLRAIDASGSLQALSWPEPVVRETRSFTASVARSERGAMPASAVREPQPMKPQPLPSGVLGRLSGDVQPGILRLNALHLGESLSVKAFDEGGQPVAPAFAALNHLMRCRISGEEIAIDPRLIRILSQLSAIYGRPIDLVSGHRKPYVIGTKPTSQHALGRAADIRIPGVGIEELRSVAMRLGARGVGLYPEKGFVHVDVREKPKYFWTYRDDEGEEADLRPAGSPKSTHRAAAAD